MKGYKVLCLTTKKIHVSRDVIFHENVFPFTLPSRKGTFPSVLQLVPFVDHLPTNNTLQTTTVMNDVVDNDVTSTELSHEQLVSPLTDNNTTAEIPSPQESHTNLPTRRSQRNHQIPKHLTSLIIFIPYLLYKNNAPSTSTAARSSIMSLNTIFSNNSHIAPEIFSPDSPQLVDNVCHDSEPSSYEEASLYPAWQAAMVQEFEALHNNNTWDLVQLPEGKKSIGCRWVYKIKHKADGSVERYKTRLVVKGYTQ